MANNALKHKQEQPAEGRVRVFHDAHNYELYTEDQAIKVEYLQLKQQKLKIRHAEIKLDDIVLRFFASSHAMYQKIKVKQGWYTFVLYNNADERVVFNGYHALPNGVAVLQSGLDYHVTTTTNWSATEVDMPEDLVSSIEGLAYEKLRATLPAKHWQLALPEPTVLRLEQELVRTYDEYVQGSDKGLPDGRIASMREITLDVITRAVQTGLNEPSTIFARDETHYSLIVQQAQTIMMAKLINNPAIAQVADELKVNVRTLQRSFEEVLGITPKQYQLAQRLDAARRALVQRGEHTTVADIAYEFGFVSPSRFCEQYHRHYGETPGLIK